jgi:hypothetical protein
MKLIGYAIAYDSDPGPDLDGIQRKSATFVSSLTWTKREYADVMLAAHKLEFPALENQRVIAVFDEI